MKRRQLRRWDNFKVVHEGVFRDMKSFVNDAAKKTGDLSYVNFRGYDLRGCDLSNTNLSNADLTDALLAKVDFNGCDLTNIRVGFN